MLRGQYDMALHLESIRSLDTFFRLDPSHSGKYTIQARLHYLTQQAYLYYPSSQCVFHLDHGSTTILNRIILFRIEIDSALEYNDLQLTVLLEKNEGPRESRKENIKMSIHVKKQILFWGEVLLSMRMHVVMLGCCKRVVPMQILEFSKMDMIEKMLVVMNERPFRDEKIKEEIMQREENHIQKQLADIEEEYNRIREIILQSRNHQTHDKSSKFKIEVSEIINILNQDKEYKEIDQKGIQLTRNKRSKKQSQYFKRMSAVTLKITKVWIDFIDIISEQFSIVQRIYQQSFDRSWRSYLSKFIAVTKYQVQCLICCAIPQRPRIHYQLPLAKNSLTYVFQDIYIVGGKAPKPFASHSRHLIVLVHGYCGRARDMGLIRRTLSILNPQAFCYASEINEQDTDSDILLLGRNLSSQLHALLSQYSMERISFVGHSLGGLIIRAALPHLLAYRHMFKTFITLSTPHIGFTLNTATVVNIGLWLFRQMRSAVSLNQLSLKDSEEGERTCLYRLSMDDSLKYFEEIVLVGCKQDLYAPIDSAMLYSDCTMAHNILKNIRKVRRVEVEFSIVDKGLDAYVGRTAHIMFLSSRELIRILYHGHPEMFN